VLQEPVGRRAFRETTLVNEQDLVAEPVRLSKPLEDWPFTRTYIRATADLPDAPGTAVFERATAHAASSPAWAQHGIATNHLIPSNRPQELADLLLALD